VQRGDPREFSLPRPSTSAADECVGSRGPKGRLRSGRYAPTQPSAGWQLAQPGLKGRFRSGRYFPTQAPRQILTCASGAKGRLRSGRYAPTQTRSRMAVSAARVEGPPSFRALFARSTSAKGGDQGSSRVHALQLRRQMNVWAAGGRRAAFVQGPMLQHKHRAGWQLAQPGLKGRLRRRRRGFRSGRDTRDRWKAPIRAAARGPEGACAGQIFSALIVSRTLSAERLKAARSSSSRS